MDNTHDYDALNIDQENEELETEVALEQEQTEESELDNEELLKLRSENKKLTEIIKRRKEREAQNATGSHTEQTINQTSSGLSREEAIFIASGYTEDDLNYLNVVAKGTGLPIKEAKEHPLFETYLQKVEADKKAKRAKLGASKGSSTQKPVELAGMTPEEHRKYWATRMGN